MAWVCAGLGAVLLIAAGLKGRSLITDFVPGKTFLLSRPVQFLTVEAELALGLWLVSGIGLAWAARVGTAFFIVLAGASGWLLASGAECCGCLGRLAVSPWFSFGFNLFAICALVLVPKPRNEEPSRPGVALSLASVFVFLAVLLPVAGWKEPAKATRTLGNAGELVVLDTDDWSGQRLPVLEHIDIGKKVSRGKWTLILIHRDCAKCEAVVKQARGDNIAVVEVPPMSGAPIEPAPRRDEAFALGRLSSRRRWVVETPKLVRVEDGIVVRVGDGLDDGEVSRKEKEK